MTACERDRQSALVNWKRSHSKFIPQFLILQQQQTLVANDIAHIPIADVQLCQSSKVLQQYRDADVVLLWVDSLHFTQPTATISTVSRPHYSLTPLPQGCPALQLHQLVVVAGAGSPPASQQMDSTIAAS